MLDFLEAIIQKNTVYFLIKFQNLTLIFSIYFWLQFYICKLLTPYVCISIAQNDKKWKFQNKCTVFEWLLQYPLKTIHKTIPVDDVFSLGRPLSLFSPRIGIITSTVYYVREIRVRLCTVINCTGIPIDCSVHLQQLTLQYIPVMNLLRPENRVSINFSCISCSGLKIVYSRVSTNKISCM